MSWARLLKRVFEFDIEQCPQCGCAACITTATKSESPLSVFGKGELKTETHKATAEAEISGLVDNWLRAVRAPDINGIVSHYAPDILAFDAVSQLQFKGVDAYRKHWEACHVSRLDDLRDPRPEH